jgi:hypothetical protein
VGVELAAVAADATSEAPVGLVVDEVPPVNGATADGLLDPASQR